MQIEGMTSMPFWPCHFCGGQLHVKVRGNMGSKGSYPKIVVELSLCPFMFTIHVNSCSPAHACVHEDTLCCTVGRTSKCTTKANSFNLYDTQASSNLARRS